ncbi:MULTISPECIES: hypothetical protein [Chelativorans]|jgi:hypothetical protein|uniref:hypothetical protein n=1 Tax=Chelativorans TaxID=449972 RepID=UPI0002D8E1BE|nr:MULTISPECIES: hypothetical protein [Chelativorans]
MQMNLQNAERHSVDIEVVERHDAPGIWSVEIINYDDEGSVYVTMFFGPRSQERAEEYAEWKRSQ